MDDVLLGIVLDRLDQQPLADEPADFLLAALDGEEALAGQLSAASGERYSPPGTAATAPDPVGAYLSSVTVEGFRGIGPAATLKVKQGPGLTLVVGRNGSGKSSFAEGLEVLLTGRLLRFKDAPVPVREGWPCKHAAGDPEVTAEFYVEGKGQDDGQPLMAVRIRQRYLEVVGMGTGPWGEAAAGPGTRLGCGSRGLPAVPYARGA